MSKAFDGAIQKDKPLFIRTTAINKILAMKARIRVIQGGTWAGKTYGIIPVTIDYCTKNARKKVLVTAETLPGLRDGAINDFKNIMQNTGRWNDARWNETHNQYTFANGTFIKFKSFDSVGKAQAAGKWHVLFINEANYMPFEIVDKLMSRTTEAIYIDYNPTAEFWVQKEMKLEELIKKGAAEFLLLKYTDNEALPDQILNDVLLPRLAMAYHDPDGNRQDPANVKDPYWSNWCRVYIDGEIGSLEGIIFSNWRIIDEVPPEARLLGNGMDFGFNPDPATHVALFKYNKAIVVDELLYQTNLINRQIYDRVKDNPGQTVADSAEPKSIAELRSYGMNIIGAVKGADSVTHGIQLLQGYEILVTARSLNLIEELRNYRWAKDKKTGKPTGQPVDAFNHLIDPLRYAGERFLTNRSTGFGGTF